MDRNYGFYEFNKLMTAKQFKRFGRTGESIDHRGNPIFDSRSEDEIYNHARALGVWSAPFVDELNRVYRGLNWNEQTYKDWSDDKNIGQDQCLEVMMRHQRQQVGRQWGELTICPTSLRQANAVVYCWHTHNRPVTGWKFGASVWDDLTMIGVCIVGRPVSRVLDDGESLEITRLAMMHNAPKNAASMLIGSCTKAAKSMGIKKVYSYTLSDELGACYSACGFYPEHVSDDTRTRHRSIVNPYHYETDQIFFEQAVAEIDSQLGKQKTRWVKQLSGEKANESSIEKSTLRRRRSNRRPREQHRLATIGNRETGVSRTRGTVVNAGGGGTID